MSVRWTEVVQVPTTHANFMRITAYEGDVYVDFALIEPVHLLQVSEQIKAGQPATTLEARPLHRVAMSLATFRALIEHVREVAGKLGLPGP